jgi:hypothetical protein
MSYDKNKIITQQKKYYYKICPHCGAHANVDNTYCTSCKKRINAVGEIKTLRESINDPALPRFNLDHPEGCQSCGRNCRYCYSFGMKKPTAKAPCYNCDKIKAACCHKARELPLITDIMPDISTCDILTACKEEYKEVIASYHKFFSSEVVKCRQAAASTRDDREAV